MLSRVAETIFWLGRYMERTNGMLQVIRTTYIRSQDAIQDFSWLPLLQTYGELNLAEMKAIETDSQKVLDYLVLDRINGASAYNNIRQSRENARAIQDHITKEVWQTLNDYYHFIRDPQFEQQFRNGDPISSLDMLIKNGLLFTGTLKNTMTRGESYTYLHLGKFLERAILSTDITKIYLSDIDLDNIPRAESPTLRYLLYSLLGFEIYMKTYKGSFNPQHVLELVVHNNHFPHSLLYSLYQVNKYFERLRPESLPESYDNVEYMIGKTMNIVKYSNLDVHDSRMISNFLKETRNEIVGIANCFGRYYFGNA